MRNEVVNGERNEIRPWFKEGKVDDLKFLDEIRSIHHYRCVDGVFYNQQEQPVADEELLNWIVSRLSYHVRTNLNKTSRQLLELMRIQWRYERPEAREHLIHVANGTLDVAKGSFTEEKEFSLSRLPVEFHKDAQERGFFRALVYSLLDEEDVETLQEYLGYCLLPTNRAQKMMIIVGKGGEGKSTLGRVVEFLLGDAMTFNSIQKVCTDRFARADLEGKLVMVDDDMSMSALRQTNYLKTMVTLQGKTDLERKGVQSYQGRLYARFLCFSNSPLSALFDQSYGFYRRQIILTTLDREPNREDEPFLADMIREELPWILNWCLEGLMRLIKNNFQFTISQRAKQNLKEAMEETDTVQLFLNSEGYIHYSQSGCASVAGLCDAYHRFCQENRLTAISDNRFQRYLKQNQSRLKITYVNNIPTVRHKTVRGYVGIQLDQQPLGWQ